MSGEAEENQEHYKVLAEYLSTVIEMSIRNRKIIIFLRSKARPVRRADNLAAIYESIVYTII
jgi:hypothetical protein